MTFQIKNSSEICDKFPVVKFGFKEWNSRQYEVGVPEPVREFPLKLYRYSGVGYLYLVSRYRYRYR
jgi:hypothetical protein